MDLEDVNIENTWLVVEYCGNAKTNNDVYSKKRLCFYYLYHRNTVKNDEQPKYPL